MFGRRRDPAARAERNLARARAAMEAGELARAAAHAGNAVTCTPTSPAVLDLLEQLARHPNGGRALFPLDDPLALAIVVGRAHVAAFEEEYGEALALLGKAQAYAPETAWADVPWVVDPALPSAIDPAEIADLAVGLLDVIPVPCPDELRPAMEPYLCLVRNAVAVHADHGNILGAAAFFVRRFDSEEAAGYAERADQLTSSPAAAIALGLIRRDQGRTDDAMRAWDRALTCDPNNLDVYADIGELLVGTGRLAEAQSYAERALQIDPGHVHSRITLLAARFGQERQAEDLDALTELHATLPADTPEHDHAGRALYSVVTASADSIVRLSGQSAPGPR